MDIKLILLMAILILSLTSFSSGSEYKKRIALVIGNSNYNNAPLKNPKNDANDIADILTKCNFLVIKLIDSDRSEIRSSIRNFGEKLKSSSVGLFYYAGHGIQVEGENYIVPVNTNIKHEYEVVDECIKISSVLRAMEYAQCELNIVILDACRNNPFKRSFRSSQRGLARINAPAGTLIAYSTSPGTVAADGDGRNGLYTSYLLKYLTEPILIEQVFKKVRISVIRHTNSEQIPWESSCLTGNFSFFEKNSDSNYTKSFNVSNVSNVFTQKAGSDLYLVKQGESEYYKKIDDRFKILDSSTVYDSYLNKKWKIFNPNLILTFDDAQNYCKTILGDEFRLPTEAELKSLIKKDESSGLKEKIRLIINKRTSRYWTNKSGWFGKRVCVDFKKRKSYEISSTNCNAFIAVSEVEMDK